MIIRLSNIQPGYCEVYYYKNSDKAENCPIFEGTISLQDLTIGVDFEKDEIKTIKRWFALTDNGKFPTNSVGYLTRKLAIRALNEYYMMFDEWEN